MQLSEEELKFVKESDAKFVSFKYLDLDNTVRQIDSAVNNLENLQLDLETIKGRHFIDPFRSQRTVSFFCERKGSKSLGLRNSRLDKQTAFTSNLYIHFWLDQENGSNHENYAYLSDPDDLYSNLRSDIIDTLEKINIKTFCHFHGHNFSESVIAIVGSNYLDVLDSYVISKFIISNVSYAYGQSAIFKDKNARETLALSGSDSHVIAKLADKTHQGHIQFSAHTYDSSVFPRNLPSIKIYCPSGFDPYDIAIAIDK